jgi:hypothetical protein
VLSESARAASAAEARFRIQAPNSAERATAVIALDQPGEAVLRRLSQDTWHRATFLKAPEADAPDGSNGPPADGWMTDLAERKTRVADQVAASDQVILLAGAGGHAAAAEVIGRACSLRRVTTTALVVGAEGSSDRELSRTLAQLRPWSLMVVIANSDDYIADMMTALRV